MVTAWEKCQELVREEMGIIYSQTVIGNAMNPRKVGDLEGARCQVA